MLLAQAETMAKAATDLVSARDVVSFMGAAIALLLGAIVWLVKTREAERKEAHDRMLKMIDDLTNRKAGDHA